MAWHWAIYLSGIAAVCGSAISPRLMRKAVAADGEFIFAEEGEAMMVDDHHPPACREDYSCDRDMESDQSTMRIAVYTYNIGGYEAMRSDFVPCVPPGVDAFLFIDEVGMRRFGKTVKQWQDLGWHIRNFTQIPGTKHVSGPRLTSKSLKFTPPSWLLNGTWHWLVEHDGNIVLDLHRLRHFVQKLRKRSLVLLNWGYHTDCTGDGFKCFMTEVSSMLTERVQYVASSRMNVLKWKELLEKMHVGKLTHGNICLRITMKPTSFFGI